MRVPQGGYEAFFVNMSLKLSEILKKAEYAGFLMMAACIPLSWQWASYVMVALCVIGCLKAVACRRQLPPLRFRDMLPYLLFSATFFCYLASVAWSDDLHEAWRMVNKKLPFLVLSATFFVSRPELDGRKLRAIMWVFAGSTLVMFAANLGYAAYDVIFREFGPRRFFNMVAVNEVHHTYMAMYACMSLFFCLMELSRGKRRLHGLLSAFCSFLLAVYVVLLDSRAGQLCMLLLIVFYVLILVFGQKRHRFGLLLLAFFCVATAATAILFPRSVSRLTQTVQSLKSETEPDSRVIISDAIRPQLGKNILFGVGCGDRMATFISCYKVVRERLVETVRPAPDASLETFQDDRAACMAVLDDTLCFMMVNSKQWVDSLAAEYHCDSSSLYSFFHRSSWLNYSIEYGLNPHNQYKDTMIAVGCVGLLFLLSYFVFPVVLMWRRGKWDVLWLSLLLIVAFNALFESVFEQQKGILFFMFLFMLFYQKNSRDVCE